MAHIRYVVELTFDDRACLLAKISKGMLPARHNTKARILLKAEKASMARDGQIVHLARFGNIPIYGRTRAGDIRDGGDGCGLYPQTAPPPGDPAHFQWRSRSQADHAGLL